MRIGAIIVAAGVGQRMGGPVPKAYLPLAGKPILAHTLEVFEAVPEVQEVTVVANPNDLEYCQSKAITPYGFRKVLRLVPGGKERQDSVYHALKALKDEELEIILVHDGVRPLVTPEAVRHIIHGAQKHGAAILGRPAFDTLKRVNPQGEVVQTLERKDIWLIQTPQGFRAELLWRAFTEAYSRNFYGTDEASLVEQLGQPVQFLPGSPYNLKITTPEDLALAEVLLPVVRSAEHESGTGV
jgi:2-C-methyl-D-erythritol 4-phosphate cytidylyltransferase